MSGSSEIQPGSSPAGSPSAREGGADRAARIDAAIRSIAGQFEITMGRAEEVEAGCGRLREILGDNPGAADLALLDALPPLLRKRAGEVAEPLFRFLLDFVHASGDPRRVLECLLDARDHDLAKRALAETARLAGDGSLPVDHDVLRMLAERSQEEGAPLHADEALERIASLAALYSPPEGGTRGDLAAILRLDEDPRVRRLAARLLDRSGEPASAETAEKLLGAEAHALLAPYLAYTRASHLDLFHIAACPGEPPPVVESIRRAERTCDPSLLRDVIAETGWARLNYGIEAEEWIGLCVAGSFPLAVSPVEATLFRRAEGVREAFRSFLFVCHGGTPLDAREEEGGDDPVARFRTYNVAHAEALGDILDVAPLTREKVHRILDRMDRIAADYVFLFSRYAEECAILPDVYRELKEKVLAELDKETKHHYLSAELTRLVQMFGDPRSLGEVRTLHGLKRYLHQRGLRLGFRLVETARATNRTVDIVSASARRIQQVVRSIHYVDFEPAEEAGEGRAGNGIPYPVRVAVDGFARQILHGQENLPGVRVFCYGNEVHYYVAFGNHPAFLRVDYAPPLRGGMIDLEFYGVSKNELAHHPNPSLDGIRLFFRTLEFDIQIDKTHIHARYDKERALDLGDICEKAEALFRLVPYLMEVDWVIGSLALGDDAKRVVAESWADSFATWGVLPIGHLLTRDRTGILVSVKPGAAGTREIAWDGKGPYHDLFSTPPPPSLLAALRASLGGIDGELLPSLESHGSRPIGQVRLEKLLLHPLREAASRGEIAETPEGYRARPPEIAGRIDEAVRFAEILAAGKEAVAASAKLAAVAAPLERTLRFRTTGSVNGYEVERARLSLRGERLGLFVLRDSGGLIRLALFARDEVLSRRRDDRSGPWRENASTDAGELLSLLRAGNYLAPGQEPALEDAAEEAARVLERIQTPNPLRQAPPLPGERIVHGLKASPGRAVGTALFGTEHRDPRDFEGAILLAPSIRPEDNTFLYHSAGIVSTGGGVLSHAGLIALQFHKPSLVITGRWERADDSTLSLAYGALEYREEKRTIGGYEAAVRRDVREREHRLREGDLVVLDAEEGTLRVLGQDPEALALHNGFRHFGETTGRLARATDETEVLVLRGDRLRARHQIEKHLRRLTDSVLARHAAHEILLGGPLSFDGGGRSEKAALLSLLLGNPRVSEAARIQLVEIAAELADRLRALTAEAERRIPAAPLAHEVITLRLRLLKLCGSMREALDSLRACKVDTKIESCGDSAPVDRLARDRLEGLRERVGAAIEEWAASPAENPGLRHLLRRAERLDLVLGAPAAGGDARTHARERLDRIDEGARRRTAGKWVLRAEDGGFELYPFIGWKAANLAELERLAGGGLVPAWFVVTDRAFRTVLGSPLGKAAAAFDGAIAEETPLRSAIDRTLDRDDIDNREKSAEIRRLWEEVRLPEDLAGEVVAAYRALGEETAGPGGSSPEEEPGPFVAIRSSAREEDSEGAARAGEFDTFLFIRGENAVLEHLRRAWSGLWTERAIHNRAVLGRGLEDTGGGILVQRIVRSRVSGVLLTINVAEGELQEMVINAGLGLGEGIVSGIVAADQVIVAKEGDLENAPLRFRYITSDKTEQVVFDKRAGMGTIRTETLYHQRLRPALEYVELRELVAVAARLETAYGYPLDIEYGIEGARLWILQARPVATFAADLRETIERYPLAGGSPAGDHPKTKEKTP
ncbi:MAG: PEP/pyruvate-binding domain-containing protein [Candidatus Eisenbacteria bacterium]